VIKKTSKKKEIAIVEINTPVIRALATGALGEPKQLFKVSKNKWGNYEDPNTNLIFNKLT
jgi:hypothetical protein